MQKLTFEPDWSKPWFCKNHLEVRNTAMARKLPTLAQMTGREAPPNAAGKEREAGAAAGGQAPGGVRRSPPAPVSLDAMRAEPRGPRRDHQERDGRPDRRERREAGEQAVGGESRKPRLASAGESDSAAAELRAAVLGTAASAESKVKPRPDERSAAKRSETAEVAASKPAGALASPMAARELPLSAARPSLAESSVSGLAHQAAAPAVSSGERRGEVRPDAARSAARDAQRPDRRDQRGGNNDMRREDRRDRPRDLRPDAPKDQPTGKPRIVMGGGEPDAAAAELRAALGLDKTTGGGDRPVKRDEAGAAADEAIKASGPAAASRSAVTTELVNKPVSGDRRHVDLKAERPAAPTVPIAVEHQLSVAPPAALVMPSEAVAQAPAPVPEAPKPADELPVWMPDEHPMGSPDDAPGMPAGNGAPDDGSRSAGAAGPEPDGRPQPLAPGQVVKF
jgi:hypothetical protein